MYSSKPTDSTISGDYTAYANPYPPQSSQPNYNQQSNYQYPPSNSYSTQPPYYNRPYSPKQGNPDYPPYGETSYNKPPPSSNRSYPPPPNYSRFTPRTDDRLAEKPGRPIENRKSRFSDKSTYLSYLFIILAVQLQRFEKIER